MATKTLLTLAIVALASPGICQEKVSGLFHFEGRRAEEYIVGDEVTEELRAKINTISGWGAIVATSKSETFRTGAAETLGWIASNHRQGLHALSPAELQEIRAEAMKLLKSKEESVRFFGANILGYAGDKTTNKLLVELLKDKNPYMRQAAIESLFFTADDACIDPLLLALKFRGVNAETYDTYGATMKIVRVLAKIGTPKARKALTDIETASREPEFKEFVRVAIDGIGKSR